MYEMTEVETVPDTRKGKRNAPHVNQLRAFLRSGKKCVLLSDVPLDKSRSVYNGLQQASHRMEFGGMIEVKRDGHYLYLVRRG